MTNRFLIGLASASLFIVCGKNAIGQTTASVSLDTETVNAGSKFTMSITVDPAPSYRGTVGVNFVRVGQGAQLANTMWLDPGQKSGTLVVDVPIDTLGGTYRLYRVYFGLSYAYELKANPVSITVVPADNLVHPTSVSVELSPTQQQFLRTEVSRLQVRVDDLMGELNKDAGEPPELRASLIAAITYADASLQKAQQNYAIIVGKTLEPHPFAFDDFHQRYQALLIELRAPMTSSMYTQALPSLLRVQLVKRPPTTPGFPNYHGTYPSEAEHTISLIDENIAFYQIIEKTGSDTFTIRLASIPTGATISFAHVGEAFREYSTPSDVPQASFPLARWLFQFAKTGCKTIIRGVDPFIEQNPDLTVELNCNQK